jgi:formiminoglutamate deiminase
MLSITAGRIHLPALATAHSHAFQRAMRGLGQRPGDSSEDDFWTWRDAMYRLASSLSPESMRQVAGVAFRELARAGVRTVGEFHYVHHQPDGTPYDDRTVMADAVIDAARAAGLRIALLRVAYHRAGAGRPAEGRQRRFCDPDVDRVLADVDTLRQKWRGEPNVLIGVGAHSVRAVPSAWLSPLAGHAARHGTPFHMHVAEQSREVAECLAETGRRPVELLADCGVLSDRFVAVHAIHVEAHEARLLGDARAFACICPTTERDLGDAFADLAALRSAGVRLCTGVDSHVRVDPIDDARSLETHERVRRRARVTFRAQDATPAEALWHEASVAGALACGFPDAGGEIRVRRDDPALELVPDEFLLDAIVFGAGPGIVETIVEGPDVPPPAGAVGMAVGRDLGAPPAQ